MSKRGRDTRGESKRGLPLLYNQSPSPLIRGRGTKGDGVTEQNSKESEVDKHSLKVVYCSVLARWQVSLNKIKRVACSSKVRMLILPGFNLSLSI